MVMGGAPRAVRSPVSAGGLSLLAALHLFSIDIATDSLV